MRILCFTKGGRETPSSNVRVWMTFDKLKEEFGIESDVFHSIGYSFWSLSKVRLHTWSKVLKAVRDTKYDLLFVHKAHFPLDIVILILYLKVFYRLPVVYDVDDPQWIHSKAQDYLLSKVANCIFASSEPFVERYKKYNNNVVLIVTGLDHEWFGQSRAEYTEKEKYVIGWIGAYTHFRDGNFHIVKPALEELGKRGYKIEFCVIGTKNYKPLIEYLKSDYYTSNLISFVPYEEVPQNIGRWDIAVAPVVPTEWFEINATGKGVEYMACGVPTVASRVGAYKHLIQDGVNSFLADNMNEWVEKLSMLLDDVGLRERMGEAGLATIAEKYSYKTLIPLIKKEFEKVIYE